MNVLNIIYIYINIITDIQLNWHLSINETHCEISHYQIFAYIEPAAGVPTYKLWEKIGCIPFFNLSVSCRLSQVNFCNFFRF